MTDDVHIYRTGDPRVLDAWADAQQTLDDYMARRKDQIEAWGFDRDVDTWTSASVFGGQRFCGIEWPEDKELPKYWRRDRDTPNMIVPRRSGAGARIGKEFDTIVTVPTPRADLSKLGMPGMVMRGGRGGMYAHAYAAKLVTQPGHASTVWVRWNVDPNPVEDDENRRPQPEAVDTDIWQPVKLSEYYAMAEAGKDPFAVKKDDD